MRLFRSKSNFMFGVIFLSVIVLYEIPMFLGLIGKENVSFASLILLILPLIISLFMFILGMQTIHISESGVTLEIFRIPLKELKWNETNEAGTGKVKISKGRYIRQLYVSQRSLNEKELDNMDKLRFQPFVIWFDYSSKAEKHLAYYLGMTDSIE